MKKLISMLVCGVICLGLAACAMEDAADVDDVDGEISVPVVAVEPEPVSQPVQEVQPVPEVTPEMAPVWTAAEGVTFGLLQEVYPVGTTRLTLVVENRSDAGVGWGTEEIYEKFVGGQWQELDRTGNIAFTDELWHVRAGEVRTMALWSLAWTVPLDEGIYRVTGSSVSMGGEEVGKWEKVGKWQVTFQITADAEPEPDYALYISRQPIPTVDGCMVTDRLPAYFINTTGEDAEVLLIPDLEKQAEDGAWNEVPWKDGIGFCGTPDLLPVKGKAWFWEISTLWGTLEDGHYRIGVQCQPYLDTEETVYGEFTLYTPEDNAGLPLAPQA